MRLLLCVCACVGHACLCVSSDDGATTEVVGAIVGGFGGDGITDSSGARSTTFDGGCGRSSPLGGG